MRSEHPSRRGNTAHFSISPGAALDNHPFCRFDAMPYPEHRSVPRMIMLPYQSKSCRMGESGSCVKSLLSSLLGCRRRKVLFEPGAALRLSVEVTEVDGAYHLTYV